jgi:putative oxidoreductase
MQNDGSIATARYAMTQTGDVAALLARILLAVIFIKSGFGKIGGFEGTVAAIASKGVPLPQVAAVVTILIELGGGLLLVFGLKARWAALLIFLWLIPSTLLFHDFWAVPAEQYRNQQTNFLKNVAIMGGMLMVFAFGPGRIAFDREPPA